MSGPKTTALGGAVNGPDTAAIQDALKAAGVERVSQLHELFGKAMTYDGQPATIVYCVNDLFLCRLADGREPSGAISALVIDGDSITFTTEGA